MKTVAKKAVHHAKRHKYKIILGAPIIFAIFVNVNELTPPQNILSITTSQTPFIAVGDTVSFDVVLKTTPLANAIGASMIFDPTLLSVVTPFYNDSIIDLWAKEPGMEENGTVMFAGGIMEKTDFTGSGNLFSFTAQALQEGTTKITLQNPEILANDGEGTNLLTEKKDVTLHIRKKGLPSPDVNGDMKISLMDINILYFNSLRKYNPLYDLNGDEKVNLADVRILLSLM